MDPSKIASALMAAARRYKERLVAKSGIGEDIPPLALLIDENGDVLLTLLLSFHTEDAKYDSIIRVGNAVALSDCSYAGFVTETYVRMDLDLDAPSPSPGTFERAFAGGDPNVMEAVTVAVVAEDRSVGFVSNCYRYDKRSVVWDSDRDGEPTSWIVNDMRECFEGRAKRPVPAVPYGVLPELVGLDAYKSDLVT